MSELSEAQLNELHAALKQLEEELQLQLERGKSSTEAVKLDQTLVGRVSRMDAMQQQSVAISTLNKTRSRLKKVLLALAAFESEDYGYCSRCDEPIAFGRLQAQPEARLCIGCQDRADKL